ncbi:hypothetical protein [Methylophaga sp.]
MILTSIYWVTFYCWLTDNSPMYQRTKRCLDTQLNLATTLKFLK